MSSKIILLLLVTAILIPEPSEAALFGRGGFFRSRGGIFGSRGVSFRRRGRGNRSRSARSMSRNRSQLNRNISSHGNNSFINDFGFRNNQFDSVFDPGVGLTGTPLALGGDLGFVSSNDLAFGNQSVKREPLADASDPCGIRISERGSLGRTLSVQGFYFDRRSNTCELGVRGQGSNPFPFRSEGECESVVRSGGCRIDSNRFESNQFVFRR